MIVAPLTSSILALLYAFLAILTIFKRRKYSIALMTQGNEEIARCMRAMGNLNEYAPIFLVLLLTCEIQKLSHLALATLSTLFLIGRILHANAILKKKGKLRVLGMSLTFTSFIALAMLQLFNLVR